MTHIPNPQSNAPLPHPRLERIAAILRQPPAEALDYNVKTVHRQMAKAARLLGIKPKRTMKADTYGHRFESLLRDALRPKIDHTFCWCTTEGDVLVWTQPYMEADNGGVQHIENAGGFVVNPHREWGFYHGMCWPVVYMIPAEKTEEFQTKLKTVKDVPPRLNIVYVD